MSGETAGAFADGAGDVPLADVALNRHGLVDVDGAAGDRQVHAARECRWHSDADAAGAGAVEDVDGRDRGR